MHTRTDAPMAFMATCCPPTLNGAPWRRACTCTQQLLLTVHDEVVCLLRIVRDVRAVFQQPQEELVHTVVRVAKHGHRRACWVTSIVTGVLGGHKADAHQWCTLSRRGKVNLPHTYTTQRPQTWYAGPGRLSYQGALRYHHCRWNYVELGPSHQWHIDGIVHACI